MWWLKQSDPARQALTGGTGVHLQVALLDFDNWCTNQGAWDKLQVWGNGAAFDNVILRGAYQRAGLAAPWRWFNDRCYRTLKSLHRGIELERTGTHHNALDDAESQARHLMRILTSTSNPAAARA